MSSSQFQKASSRDQARTSSFHNALQPQPKLGLIYSTSLNGQRVPCRVKLRNFLWVYLWLKVFKTLGFSRAQPKDL